MTSYGAGILSGIKDKVESSEGNNTIEELPEDTDWLNLLS